MKFRTAEVVFDGHPDKLCDQISDAILDAYLAEDPDSRVAIETMGGHGKLVIMGEVTSKANIEIEEIASQVYSDLGYKDEIGIFTNVVKQSPDIAQGVDDGGAGDQGIMVGYATNETEEMLPKELVLARKLAKAVSKFKGYGPDGKCQVTLNDKGEVETVVLSVQTTKTPIGQSVVEKILDHKIKEYYFNPTGKFEVGGLIADTGLTGRKLVVDNYGPQIPLGGGAFSGKDPSKVDRSAAYMARYLAKRMVKEFDLDNALVKIAYSIGVAEPVMVTVQGKKMDRTVNINIGGLKNIPDLTPQGIIKFLDLKRPIYQETAKWGHFGNKNFKWEQI